MDENALIKALYIGVSLFVTVITITAITLYYNIARSSIKDIGSGTDFDTVYREDIKETLLKTGGNNKITGTQVKNLVNYYYDNINVQIKIDGIKYISEDGSIKEYSSISLSSNDQNIRQKNYNIIMKNIMNNQEFILHINTDNEDILIITVKGE